MRGMPNWLVRHGHKCDCGLGSMACITSQASYARAVEGEGMWGRCTAQSACWRGHRGGLWIMFVDFAGRCGSSGTWREEGERIREEVKNASNVQS